MDTSAPPVMVKASSLATSLRRAIGDGVESALLLTTSGALMCTASNRVAFDFARSQECRKQTAIVANLWRTYAQSANGMPCDTAPTPHGDASGGGAAANQDLELVLAELETHRLCCVGLGGRAVLALFATPATELGMLKLKAASLQAELFDGLRLAPRGGAEGGSGFSHPKSGNIGSTDDERP